MTAETAPGQAGATRGGPAEPGAARPSLAERMEGMVRYGIWVAVAMRSLVRQQTAEDVAATLGTMKGVLMKLGQMASYVHYGLSPDARRALSRLQDGACPMSPRLAAWVVAEELGLPPEQAFAAWDPEPIAAASIGQVHRAITHGGRAVAVKVQYPGIAETIQADVGNVDPHPGNYLFHGDGKVTFLDFGLVKRFSASELRPVADMARCLCVDHDPEAFRRANEDAGILLPSAPVSTQTVVEQMAVFYEMIREPGPRKMTGEYASAVAGRLVDVRSPLAAYVQLPRSYVILQRINLGLYALLGDLSATCRLAPHRRGDLAVRPGTAVHPDRDGRGRLACEQPVTHPLCASCLPGSRTSSL